MHGVKYLWDTNIVIYFLQQQLPPASEDFIDAILKHTLPGISVISEIELLSLQTLTDKEIREIKDFNSNCSIFELNGEVKSETIKLRRKLKMKLPDAIIAATAVLNSLTILTRNTKDFKHVENLKTFDPWNC